MRKLIPVAAALAALLWSAAAWAVVKETQITIRSGGAPVPNATVTLSEPKPSLLQFGATPKQTPTVRARTDDAGRATMLYDSEDAVLGWTVDVTVRTTSGQTHTARDVPLLALVSGIPLQIPQAAPTPASLGPGQFYLPGTDVPIRIGGYGGVANRSIGKDAGLGVVVTPGDPFFLSYPDRVLLWGGSVYFDTRIGDRMHNLSINYGRGSDRTSVEEPNGGNTIGFVSGDPAGPSLDFGAFGFSATGKVSLDSFGLSYKSMQKFNLDNGFGWGWGSEAEEELRESYKWFGWVATFNYSGFDYSGHLQRTPDPTDVYVDVNHSLDSYRVMFGPAISGRRMLSNNFYLLGQADAQFGFVHSSLDTREVICAGLLLCGGVPTEVNISDSKTSFAWDVGAKVGIGATLASGFDATLTAGVRLGNRHTANIRQNPSDRGTQIGSATGYDWDVMFSLSRPLGY